MIPLRMLAITVIAYLEIASTLLTPVNKLVIDTDAGSDDALALMILLDGVNPNQEILGITCVSGNTDVDNVGRNVLKTLDAADKLNIPVYQGVGQPLLSNRNPDFFFGNDGFGDFQYENPPSETLIRDEHAVNAMVEMVKTYPGDVTLVALGPLTNIALAIKIYPDFLKDVRHLYVMGGSTGTIGNVEPGVEFNFREDPSAVFITLNASIGKPLTLIPWETVLRTSTTIDFFNSLVNLKTSKSDLISNAMRKVIHPTNKWRCADAVVAAIAVTSGEIVTESQTYSAEVIYKGGGMDGMIVVDYTNISKRPVNINLVKHINQTAYLDLIEKSLR